MSQLKARCIDQVLTFENTPVITSGNVNYDSIMFDFCSRWDGFTKTAIFYRSEDEVYYQLLDEANTCLIPNEVLTNKGDIFIGVFGVNGDTTLTSQVLKYKITKGAITENLIPADPTPDIYSQIISRYNHYDERLAYFEERFNGSVGDAEKLGGHGAEYFAPLTELAKYFKNTGGTIADKNAVPLIVSNTTDGATQVRIAMQAGGTNLGYFAFNGVDNPVVVLTGGFFKKLLHESNISNYALSNAGGTVNGNVTVKADDTNQRIHALQNSVRRVFQTIAPSGNYNLYDGTNNNAIIVSTADGTNTFNGTASGNLPINSNGKIPVEVHIQKADNGYTRIVKNNSATSDFGTRIYDVSADEKQAGFGWSAGSKTPSFVDSTGKESELLHTGNMASHVLPLDGGGTVKATNPAVMVIDNTGDNVKTLFGYKNKGTLQGYFGFNGANKPIYQPSTGGEYDLLHTGNSAKVHIGTSALSDTSSVWIDTSE